MVIRCSIDDGKETNFWNTRIYPLLPSKGNPNIRRFECWQKKKIDSLRNYIDKPKIFEMNENKVILEVFSTPLFFMIPKKIILPLFPFHN